MIATKKRIKFRGNPYKYIDTHFLMIKEMVAHEQRVKKVSKNQAIKRTLKKLFIDDWGKETLEDIYVAMNTVCEKHPVFKAAISKYTGALQMYCIGQNL